MGSSDDLDEWFMSEVLPYEAGLMAYLRRNWRDPGEVADLRQEVYMRVYAAARRERPAGVQAFVFMTARNLLIDRMRRARVVPIDAVADIDGLRVAADEPWPDAIAASRDELRRLKEALDQLPAKCRQVMVLRKIEGLSQRETARRLGVTEDTVERHVLNGVRALADRLFGRGAGFGVLSAAERRRRGAS